MTTAIPEGLKFRRHTSALEAYTRGWEEGQAAAATAVVALDTSDSYQAGRRDALAELRTSSAVALEVGISEVQLARRAVKRGIGLTINSRVRLYTNDDVEKLR